MTITSPFFIINSTLVVTLIGLMPVDQCVGQSNTPAEFEGHSAWQMTLGIRIPANCRRFSWMDPKSNKRYCFESEEAKAKFLEDVSGNLKRAIAENERLTAPAVRKSKGN